MFCGLGLYIYKAVFFFFLILILSTEDDVKFDVRNVTADKLVSYHMMRFIESFGHGYYAFCLFVCLQF